MNFQEDKCSPKKKVITLADKNEVDVSCDIDSERVEKLNDFTKNKVKTFFFKDQPHPASVLVVHSWRHR